MVFFFSWGEAEKGFVFSTEKNTNAAALECMGGHDFMGIDRPRGSLCVGGFAQGRAGVRAAQLVAG